MHKAFFFDFDGVIVDSTRIKTDAFYELFLDHGENVALAFKEYHLKNQGVDRYIKIKYAFSDILRLPCSDKTLAIYADRFSRIVLDKILICDYVPGIIDFLWQLKSRNKFSFLLSATPEAELRKICEARGLNGYFREICGAPLSKPDHGERIMEDYHIARRDIMFFGDSYSDLLAARTLDVDFTGVSYRNTYSFEDGIRIIPDFYGDRVASFLS